MGCRQTAGAPAVEANNGHALTTRSAAALRHRTCVRAMHDTTKLLLAQQLVHALQPGRRCDAGVGISHLEAPDASAARREAQRPSASLRNARPRTLRKEPSVSSQRSTPTPSRPRPPALPPSPIQRQSPGRPMASNKEADYYEVLGISKSAKDTEASGVLPHIN